ncbi:protein phosphatase 2C domain-containing protein [Streptomyces sp. 7N604]|uniref:protein phosphatase 2C domain-containing protein n=1 Tax=Streptomyces sp. 7N604 TaxID=3457415 RepID=UPI003FD1FA27
MSQMPQVPQLSACPRCDEPLESGDNFCGACGTDLSSAPQPPADRPAAAPARAASAAPPRPGHAPTAPDGAAGPAGTESGSASAPSSTQPLGQGERALPPPVPGTRLPDGTAVPPLPDHPPTTEGTAPAAGPPHGAGIPSAAQEAHAPEDLASADSAPTPPPPRGAAAVSHGSAAAAAAPASAPEDREPADAGGEPSSGGRTAGAEDYPLASPAAESGHGGAPVDPRTTDAYGLAAPPRTVDDTPGGAAADPAAAEGRAGASTGETCVACRAGVVDHDGYCGHCGHAQPRKRDHMEQVLDSVAAVSDRGLRHHRNEDAFAVSATALPDSSPAVVAVVCDGVSSATRPDEASQAASDAASESLLAALPCGTHPQQAMHDAILAAAEAVNSLAAAPNQPQEHDPHRHHENAPACTIVSAIVASGILTVGWIGDSRAYWVPDDRTATAARLTEDDSWAAQMVATGLMSEAEAYADERAHAITGWLGADAYELEPHTASFKPDRPGVVVVCTDGLWNYAEGADEMALAVPADARARPLHSARTLVGYALDGGGHDNVTVAVVPFPSPAAGAGSA